MKSSLVRLCRHMHSLLVALVTPGPSDVASAARGLQPTNHDRIESDCHHTLRKAVVATQATVLLLGACFQILLSHGSMHAAQRASLCSSAWFTPLQAMLTCIYSSSDTPMYITTSCEAFHVLVPQLATGRLGRCYSLHFRVFYYHYCPAGSF